MKALHGIIPALVTPFTVHDELDEVGFKWLCSYSIDNGVHGLILNGSLGEFPSLTAEERRTIIQIAAETANNRVPVIVGVGSPSTDLAVKLAKDAEELGADMLEVLPPFYYQIGDEALFAHYKSVAEAIGIPMILYNFPAATKTNLSPQLVARLSEVDGIVGIKDSVDSLIHLRELVRLTKGKPFTVLCGMEDYLLPGLLLGAKGTVSGLGNFVPRVLVKIYEDFTKGRIAEASELFNRIIIPLKALAPPPEPISALKIGVKLVSGVTTARVRLPLIDAAKDTERRMESFLSENGLLAARARHR
jgi:4-hydroxy-tetrahydrodipicolinate synthase